MFEINSFSSTGLIISESVVEAGEDQASVVITISVANESALPLCIDCSIALVIYGVPDNSVACSGDLAVSVEFGSIMREVRR